MWRNHNILTASFDRRVTNRNTKEHTPKIYFKKNDQPSLDLFFLTRVPPNFPRKDSSFFILCVLADVFPDISGVRVMRAVSVSLSLLHVMHLGPVVQSRKDWTEYSWETNGYTESALNDSRVSKRFICSTAYSQFASQRPQAAGRGKRFNDLNTKMNKISK